MKRLYRSEEDKILGGVLGGISEYFSVDPILIRILAVLIAIGTGIVPFALVYLLMIFMVPNKSGGFDDRENA